MPSQKEKDFIDQKALAKAKGGEVTSPELANRDMAQISEILFQDLSQSEEFAVKGDAGEITLEEIPWKPLSEEEADAVSAEEDAPVVIVDEQSIQEVIQLNRKVFQNCHAFLDLVPRLHTLTRPEWEAYKVKMVLDRDVIEERMQKIQSWVNACILRGELEQMKYFNEVKASLYETLNLLRKLITEHFSSQTAPISGQNVATLEKAAATEFLEAGEMGEAAAQLKHKRYARPVAKKKKEKLGFVFTSKVVNPDQKQLFIKKMVLFALVAAVQVVFLISYFSASMPFEKIQPEIYASSIMLNQAKRLQGSFIGEVKEGWVTLSQSEKKRQVDSLAQAVQVEGIESISLSYPNQNPAAIHVLGHTTIF